jgi:hypothetical protein
VKYTITNDLEALLPMADVLYVNRVEEEVGRERSEGKGKGGEGQGKGGTGRCSGPELTLSKGPYPIHHLQIHPRLLQRRRGRPPPSPSWQGALNRLGR